MRRRELDFKVGGRYGYSAVDVYDRKTGAMLDTAIAGVTKKEAQIIAGAMYDVQGTRYQRLAQSAVTILKRQDMDKKLKEVV
jgi:hypothetical protein